MLRDYGAATFTWDTTGLASGTYTFGVWARAAGSSVVVDVGMEQPYLLQSSPPCDSVSMIPNPASPQPPGTSVTLTASSTGCITGEYKFWVRPPGATSFTMLRDYGAAVFVWDTTGLAEGAYTFSIWARAAGSSTVVDWGMEENYVVGPSAPVISSVGCPVSILVNQLMQCSPSVTGSATTYSVDMGNGATASGVYNGPFSFGTTYLSAGIVTVALTVCNGASCSGAQQIVTVNP